MLKYMGEAMAGLCPDDEKQDRGSAEMLTTVTIRGPNAALDFRGKMV